MDFQLAIIEDNTNFRESLQLFIERDRKIQVILAVDSIEAFDLLYQEQHLDGVLLDINLPGMCGLEGIFQIRKQIPTSCPIIMLTINEDQENIRDAIRNGADGYLLKTEPLSEIYRHVIDVLQFQKVALSRHVFHSLQQLMPHRSKSDTLIDKLTQREREITREVLLGHDYKTTAANLDISTGTVNFHLKSIYIKLDVNSKTELMALLLS